MNALLIATDEPRRPKKSVLLLGPEHDPDDVRREFYRLKESGANSSGLPWVQLWQATGQQIAHTPNKPNKEKK